MSNTALPARRLCGNELKLLAILAMTVDHIAWMLFPGYSMHPLALLMHAIGRLTCPIMCYFIAEGYHYTRSFQKYALRLLLLAAALGYTLSGIMLRGDAKHGSIQRDIRPLTICFSGRERRVRVLEDTGHSLTEPVSGKPVLILCRGEAALLLNDPLDGDAAHQLTALPAETAAHCGLVPYRAVGTESGLLLYFRPDRVLEDDGKTLDCVCAAGPPGFESGQYEGLICV